MSRPNRVELRTTREEQRQIKRLAKHLGLSYADTIRLAIRRLSSDELPSTEQVSEKSPAISR